MKFKRNIDERGKSLNPDSRPARSDRYGRPGVDPRDVGLRLRANLSREDIDSMAGPSSISINAPKQDRSRASFERVLDTAVELLKERGYEGFTLQEVSRQSKTSIGSIYCRVTGKDELFHAVQEHALARIDAEVRAILDPAKWVRVPPQKLIRFLVRELGEHLRRHTAILRAFISREASDPVVRKRGKKSHALVAEYFQALMMHHADEFIHPDPEHGVAFCFNLTFAAIAKHLDLDTITPSQDGAQWNQLIEDLGRVTSLYLLSDEFLSDPTHLSRNGRGTTTRAGTPSRARGAAASV
jgi:AcrR family transcriptional regulator